MRGGMWGSPDVSEAINPEPPSSPRPGCRAATRGERKHLCTAEPEPRATPHARGTRAQLQDRQERLHTLRAHGRNFRTNRLLSCLTACLPGHPSTKAAVSTSSSFLPREELALPPPSTSALFFARKTPWTVPDGVVLLTIRELLFRHRGPMLPCPQEGPEKPRLAERKHLAGQGSSLGCLALGLHLCLTPAACVAAAGVSVTASS